MNGGPIGAQQQKGVTPPAPRDALDPPAPLVLSPNIFGPLPMAPVVPGGAGQDFVPAGGRLAPTARVAAPAPFPLVVPSGRFVRLPGEEQMTWMAEGAPAEPAALVALLYFAWSDAAGSSRAGEAEPEGPTHLTIPEVLRLGDRASWVKAREIWEQFGSNLLDDLNDVMDDTELGGILPLLRGVVPTEQLVKLWDGYFSNDVAGIIRTLERMPDEELLGLVSDYRKTGKLTGTSADSLVGTVSNILRREDDNGYRALRALVARFGRVTGATGPQLEAADRDAAVNLTSELRVKAAFLRICEADRRSSPDLGYLAVTDLKPHERYWLQSQYLQSWTPSTLGGTFQKRLYALLESNDDVSVIMRALDLSQEQAARDNATENAVGVRVAAEALGTALRQLTETAGDPKATEPDRETARTRLQEMADNPATVNRLLALPDGEKLVRQGLGLSRAEVARYRVLQATTATELINALKGLHAFNVSAILEAPDVKQHLADKELAVTLPMMRVLDAYAALEGAQPTLSLVLTPGMVPVGNTHGLISLDLGPSTDADVEEKPPATLQLASAPDPNAPDPQVVVAAYTIHRAAQADDLAGVVAAVRPLRRSQRAALRDEAYFQAALETLRSSWWDKTPGKIADVIADPYADLQVAADALIAAGLVGEVPYAYDVADARKLAEGLAVDPRDRRLLRYHYVIEALEAEESAAGGGGWLDTRLAMSRRGVPPELEIGSELTTAYENRMFVIDRLDPVPKLRAEEAFLGEPDLTRPDMSPEELALEAEFMRIRLHKQLAAASAGIDASGVFGWSPETVTEMAAEFERVWARFSTTGWSHPALVQLGAAYYDALDAIDRNRGERNEVAQFVGQLAATVAGIVVIVATAGTGTPLVVSMLMAAGLGAGASASVAAQFRDYTTPDQAVEDVAHGAVTAALTVAGESFSNPVGQLAGKQMARFAARSAVNKAVAGAARMAVEGAIDGAIGGAGDAVFTTAIDRATWERSASAIFARFLSAAAQGAFWGGVTGAVASPVVGGAFAGAGRLLRIAGELGAVGGEVASGLEHVAALADQGRFDVALRRLDELNLTGAQRDALTQDLYRRALGSSADGAAVPDHVLRELENARQVTRSLEYEPAARPGERPRLDVTPIEDLLKRLEADLGAGNVTHVRKILYGEIRLAPEELITKQHAFGRGLDDALAELASPAERAAMPPYEVRVLPPEAFEGMFRTRQGRALTLLEGDRAVVYVRSDAPIRTQMLQEAAHLRQLADPEFAADVRFLTERNVLDWADKSAEDRLHLLHVQRRLEIDAQERILAALKKEAPYGGVTPAELAEAQARLAELSRHEAEARALTPEDIAEMNAGTRPRPSWMEEEARLFGRETVEVRPPAPASGHAPTAKVVTDSPAPRTGQRAYQIGDEWPKHTYVTSGIEGKVTAIDTVDGTTAVTVTPTGGGEPRVYLIEAGGTTLPGIELDAEVQRGTRLGGWSQRYRLIEVRSGKTVLRKVEEVFDAKGNWVERGSYRTTRGEILEEAAQLQVSAELTREARRRGTTLTDWWIVPRGRERWGFDRVVVEFHGEGAEMTALIRVLEVKDYPNSYVPLAEFTAITDNFAKNLGDLRAVLRARAKELAKAGETHAAKALSNASKAGDVQVEIWLGPKTKMGESELDARSVLGRLRASVNSQPGNVKLKEGGPTDVRATYQRQAVEARKAAKAK
ncbi:hypothetical protein SAMN05444365_10635 [Micromonospora pattaloongensis]|uniref:Uncharacterized protein n=1 Tax=Micromonospora pattaloongensis TaxID=405436 RepID=A0A1H3QQR7_9ACTN|nr:hypothetical protein [Micromonospora pattaloongensis]SDZ15049.1 hypothetical protein SAMN05444365_10635 [Micromonospora pattaloongensis]